MEKIALKNKFTLIQPRYWLLVGGIIFLIGALITILTARQTEMHDRKLLLTRTETIAALIYGESLSFLSGTLSDLDTPSYQNLKVQLMKVRAVNPDARFIYLMGFRDDKLFFYADSESAESEDISLPGDFYDDASEFKMQNASAGVSFVEGPYTDEWGTWVSGYAPVVDHDTNKPVAVVGIDISAQALKHDILYSASLPATVTIFVLILLWFYYHHVKRQKEYIAKLQLVDQMKSEFVSVASHQLRTPLTGIKWFAELMIRGKAGAVSPEQKDFLEQIHSSNERMIKLVEELLNVSRIETGTKFEIKKIPTDVVEIINSLTTDLVGLSHKHEVVLEKSTDFPTKYELPLDADKIRQVFANLLSNAVKYSKKGGKVTVDFKDRQTENKVLITIKDTGLGIPAKQQSRMFEKFFRADNVQTAETEGTGLGLYIAKAIIEGHGGKLWFESEENVGTTFFVELPTNSPMVEE